MNIWDINWFIDSANNATEYKAKNYFVNQLIVMTATGGRSTNSNEYMSLDSLSQVQYNFTKLDRMIDWLKESRELIPIFVIGNTPRLITPNASDIDYGAFDADTSIPSDYHVYYNYIQALTQHVLNYGGSEFVNKWTWRIYTEPDNTDWILSKLDGYFQIYNTTCRAIRSVLPSAKLETGNMVTRDYDDIHIAFFNKLHTECHDVFPNVVGWSLYVRAGRDVTAKSEFELVNQWREYFINLGHSEVDFVFEEGMILQDEDGKRLWGGDSTELGAAFTASIFSQSISQNISRYTGWSFFSSESRTPKLNVVDMFRRFQNESLINVNINYDSFTFENRKTVGALASRTLNGSSVHLMVYNLISDRFYQNDFPATILIKNLPTTLSQKSIFGVNKTLSNFHTEWDVLSKNFTYTQRDASQKDGSRYDIEIGHFLDGEEKAFYYNWSWENRNRFQLEKVSEESFSSSTEMKFTMKLNSNSVFLIELK
jgi:hypothetical protein